MSQPQDEQQQNVQLVVTENNEIERERLSLSATKNLRNSAIDEKTTKLDDDLRSTILKHSNQRSSKQDESITLDKLRFDETKLYGRQDAMDFLTEKIENNTVAVKSEKEDDHTTNDGNNNNNAQVIFVAGNSGAGKSVLVEACIDKYQKKTLRESNKKKKLFLQQQQEQQQQQQSSTRSSLPESTRQEPEQELPLLFYSKGKFDSEKRNQPYSASSVALTQLCSSILQLQDTDPEKFQKVKQIIDKEIGSDGAILLGEIVTNLRDIINNPCDIDVDQDAAMFLQETSYNRYKATMTSSRRAMIYHSRSRRLGRSMRQKTQQSLKRFPPPLCEHSDERSRLGTAGDEYGIDSVLSSKSTFVQSGDKTFNNQQRLHLYISKFIEALCSIGSKVIIFLDDLQWADLASLDLLYGIVTTRSIIESNKLIIIGSYRENEVNLQDKTNPLSAMRHKIMSWNERQQKSRNNNSGSDMIGMSTLRIGNLQLEHITDFISYAIRMETRTDDLESLAMVVRDRTLGNAYFVKQFLIMLVDCKLLSFNFGLMKWIWNVDKIRNETDAADNVVSILSEKMKRDLSISELKVLQIVSFLGSSFELSTARDVVDAILSSLSSSSKKTSSSSRSIGTMLRVFAEKGLLEFISGQQNNGQQQHPEEVKEKEYSDGTSTNGQLRFVHDAVQHAAHSVIPTTNASNLRFQIGKALQRELFINGNFENSSAAEGNNKRNHSYDIFLVVDLLNSGVDIPNDDDDEMLELVEQNCIAGFKAMEISAFTSAVSYFQMGILLLQSKDGFCWSDECYHLSLSLHTKLAVVQCCLGNFEQMEYYVNEVLIRTQNRPLEDKLGVYYARIEALASQMKLEEALDECLSVLRMCNVKFPSIRMAKLATVPAVLKTLGMVKKYSPISELGRCLPPLEDDIRIAAMYLMSKAARFSYLSHPDLTPHMSIRGVQWTIKYGICEYSCSSLCGWALINIALGNLYSACEIAKYTVSLADELESKEMQGFSRQIAFGFVLHWGMPYRLCRASLMEGYQYSLQAGTSFPGMSCLFQHALANLYTGCSLDVIISDLRVYLKQSNDFHQSLISSYMAVVLQTVKNLMERDRQNPIHLEGEIIASNEVDSLLNGSISPDLTMFTKSCILLLSVLFGRWETAEKMVKETSQIATVSVGSPYVWRNLLWEGLTACNAKDKSAMKKATRTAKKYVDGGNVNCLHIYELLKAEEMTMLGKRNNDKIKTAYKKAIIAAGRSGHQNDFALANERAGEYYAKRNGKPDIPEASHYLKAAYKAYTDWGAFAVASNLVGRHPNIFAGQ